MHLCDARTIKPIPSDWNDIVETGEEVLKACGICSTEFDERLPFPRQEVAVTTCCCDAAGALLKDCADSLIIASRNDRLGDAAFVRLHEQQLEQIKLWPEADSQNRRSQQPGTGMSENAESPDVFVH
jgi:hypothetical protein